MDGPPLTAEQVAALPLGTRIVVIWTGGNGPWTYTVADDRGTLVAASDDELARGRLDPVKAITGPEAFVGQERFHTRVWLAAES